MTSRILFSETQRFTQWWLWLILVGAFAMPLYMIFKQLQAPLPFSDLKDNAGIFLSAIIMIPVFALFLFMRLETRIKEDGINVRFFPFHFKNQHYAFSELEQVYVREYSPLGEFGGWGLRFGLNGKAYNVSGNQGIQLVFKNGKKLLIGTQKPEEARAALEKTQAVQN